MKQLLAQTKLLKKLLSFDISILAEELGINSKVLLTHKDTSLNQIHKLQKKYESSDNKVDLQFWMIDQEGCYCIWIVCIIILTFEKQDTQILKEILTLQLLYELQFETKNSRFSFQESLHFLQTQTILHSSDQSQIHNFLVILILFVVQINYCLQTNDDAEDYDDEQQLKFMTSDMFLKLAVESLGQMVISKDEIKGKTIVILIRARVVIALCIVCIAIKKVQFSRTLIDLAMKASRLVQDSDERISDDQKQQVQYVLLNLLRKLANLSAYCSEKYLDNAVEFMENAVDYWKIQSQKMKGNCQENMDYEQEEDQRRKRDLDYQMLRQQYKNVGQETKIDQFLKKITQIHDEVCQINVQLKNKRRKEMQEQIIQQYGDFTNTVNENNKNNEDNITPKNNNMNISDDNLQIFQRTFCQSQEVSINNYLNPKQAHSLDKSNRLYEEEGSILKCKMNASIENTKFLQENPKLNRSKYKPDSEDNLQQKKQLTNTEWKEDSNVSNIDAQSVVIHDKQKNNLKQISSPRQCQVTLSNSEEDNLNTSKSTKYSKTLASCRQSIGGFNFSEELSRSSESFCYPQIDAVNVSELESYSNYPSNSPLSNQSQNNNSSSQPSFSSNSSYGIVNLSPRPNRVLVSSKIKKESSTQQQATLLYTSQQQPYFCLSARSTVSSGDNKNKYVTQPSIKSPYQIDSPYNQSSTESPRIHKMKNNLQIQTSTQQSTINISSSRTNQFPKSSGSSTHSSPCKPLAVDSRFKTKSLSTQISEQSMYQSPKTYNQLKQTKRIQTKTLSNDLPAGKHSEIFNRTSCLLTQQAEPFMHFFDRNDQQQHSSRESVILSNRPCVQHILNQINLAHAQKQFLNHIDNEIVQQENSKQSNSVELMNLNSTDSISLNTSRCPSKHLSNKHIQNTNDDKKNVPSSQIHQSETFSQAYFQQCNHSQFKDNKHLSVHSPSNKSQITDPAPYFAFSKKTFHSSSTENNKRILSNNLSPQNKLSFSALSRYRNQSSHISNQSLTLHSQFSPQAQFKRNMNSKRNSIRNISLNSARFIPITTPTQLKTNEQDELQKSNELQDNNCDSIKITFPNEYDNDCQKLDGQNNHSNKFFMFNQAAIRIQKEEQIGQKIFNSERQQIPNLPLNSQAKPQQSQESFQKDAGLSIQSEHSPSFSDQSPINQDCQNFQDYLSKVKSNQKSSFSQSKRQFHEKLFQNSSEFINNQTTINEQPQQSKRKKSNFNTQTIQNKNISEQEQIRLQNNADQGKLFYGKYFGMPEHISVIRNNHNQTSNTPRRQHKSSLELSQNEAKILKKHNLSNQQSLLIKTQYHRSESISFKLPKWAEKNQRKFPQFFNQSLNKNQKALFDIIEFFKTIILILRFLKKVIATIRKRILLKNEQAQAIQEDSRQNRLGLSQRKIKKRRQKDRKLSIFSENLNLFADSPKKQQNFKQQKDLIYGQPGLNNNILDPHHKWAGLVPPIIFTSQFKNRILQWQLSCLPILLPSSNSTEFDISQLDQIVLKLRVEQQTFEFQLKFNSNIPSQIIPSQESQCQTLWPAVYLLLRQALQEKNFTLEDDSNEENFIEEHKQTEDNFSNTYYFLNQLKRRPVEQYQFILTHNLPISQKKKNMQIRDLESIGMLSNLISKYASRRGRIESKMSGSVFSFADHTFDASFFLHFQHLQHSLLRSKSVFIDFLISSPQEKVLESSLQKHFQLHEQGYADFFAHQQKQLHHIASFILKKKSAYFIISVSLAFKYDIFQLHKQSHRKIKFSLYIIAKNTDLNSQVKPIEIPCEKLSLFFNSKDLQYAIKQFIIRGSLSKKWKLNIIKFCSLVLDIIQIVSSTAQVYQKPRVIHYNQELYLKDWVTLMSLTNDPLESSQQSSSIIPPLMHWMEKIDSKTISDNTSQDTKQFAQIFDNNFNDIYDRFFAGKREMISQFKVQQKIPKVDYNNVKIGEAPNDFEENYSESAISIKNTNLALPQEVLSELDGKFDQLNYFQQNRILRRQKSKHQAQEITRKYTKKLKEICSSRGQTYFLKNPTRGINFMMQVLVERNNTRQEIKEDSVECFIYDYELQQRHFIQIKEKKQIKLLLNVIELNLEAFLMDPSSTRNFRAAAIQEMFKLVPSQSRYKHQQPFLKTLDNNCKLQKKMRVSCPISTFYHLLADSRQLSKFYHLISRNYTLDFDNIGKCFVAVTVFYSKCSYSKDSFAAKKQTNFNKINITNEGDDNKKKTTGLEEITQKDKLSVLVSLHIMPLQHRYKAYKYFLSLEDIKDLNKELFQHFQQRYFQEIVIIQLIKLLSLQLVKIRTNIGSVLAIPTQDLEHSLKIETKQLGFRDIKQLSAKLNARRQSKMTIFEDYPFTQSINQISKEPLSLDSSYELTKDNLEYDNSRLDLQLNEEEMDTLEHLNNKKQRLYVKSFKYSRNKIIKHEFQETESTTQCRFLANTIEQKRIVLQSAHVFFKKEYAIITIFRELIKQHFIFSIYIPKSCRMIQFNINDDTFEDLNSSYIDSWIQEKLIFFQQNQYLKHFQNFLSFYQRVNACSFQNLQDLYHIKCKICQKSFVFCFQFLFKEYFQEIIVLFFCFRRGE